jgi:hypothetical protein
MTNADPSYGPPKDAGAGYDGDEVTPYATSFYFKEVSSKL